MRYWLAGMMGLLLAAPAVAQAPSEVAAAAFEAVEAGDVIRTDMLLESGTRLQLIRRRFSRPMPLPIAGVTVIVTPQRDSVVVWPPQDGPLAEAQLAELCEVLGPETRFRLRLSGTHPQVRFTRLALTGEEREGYRYLLRELREEWFAEQGRYVYRLWVNYPPLQGGEWPHRGDYAIPCGG